MKSKTDRKKRDHSPAVGPREAVSSDEPIFWRVEGSLLNLGAVRPVAFFTWNAQSFTERWVRRGLLFLSALFRPLLYACNRSLATRLLHVLLKGISRDRLDLLGEEFFQYRLQPRLRKKGVDCLKKHLSEGKRIILVSQGLDHLMKPLAAFLGVGEVLANRLDFHDGLATGRLLDPVVRPRGLFARIRRRKPDGRMTMGGLTRDLGFTLTVSELLRSVVRARRENQTVIYPAVLFREEEQITRFSVKENLSGKTILLIGVTGFIGKVWLAQLLESLPEIRKIYLLIRRQRSSTAEKRFLKMEEESPVFDTLFERHGDDFARFMAEYIEVVEGDLTRSDLGLADEMAQKLREELDLVVNSSGLTDFNPDLRSAVSANILAPLNAVEFVRSCRKAALMHLSTCFVAGLCDGRIPESPSDDYAPRKDRILDAQQELQVVQDLIAQAEKQSESEELGRDLEEQLRSKKGTESPVDAAVNENQIRKARIRWLRQEMVDVGIQRANHWGWPNIYTYTKSLAESMIESRAKDLPIAIVRPSIVETSTRHPFPGWNEGVNTSAPLAYLLGTYFRQLPSNEEKCLDIVPVDLVCRGMTLIAAALVARCHRRVYHLASSSKNPCNMRRSIELTGLAHRKHYRAQEGLESWLRARFDSISVSKTRYEKMSVPRQKKIIQILALLSRPFPPLVKSLIRKERALDRVASIVELYEPFILHNQHVFESDHIEFLSQALIEEEKSPFQYDVFGFDWWDYWINTHVPALRKWCYPLIEQRPMEHRRSRSLQPIEEPEGPSTHPN